MKKILGTLLIVILAGFAWWKFKETENTIPVVTPGRSGAMNQDMMSGQMGPQMMDSRKYRNGIYTAAGMYQSPAGTENIEISLIIKDDVIVSGTFSGKAENPTSIKMQGQFSAGFNSYVVGKKVDDMEVMAVNGSSLTPKGFMDALSKIKLEAQV